MRIKNDLSNAENWEVVSLFVINENVKHYSFDFWNTIAFSNTMFKKERAVYISNILNNAVSLISIDAAFHKIGQEYNLLQESGKRVISPADLLEKVLYELQPFASHFNFEVLIRDIDKLFIDFPPLIDEHFKDVLASIFASGKTCSITSNTAFISGKTIKQYLKNLGLLKKISFCLFSDEVGYAKPSKEIYESLHLSAKTFHSNLKASEIIHFGDNKVADYNGASFFGFRSFLFYINNNLLNPRYSLYTINDVANIPFSDIEYSKFKFGDSSIAKKYGNELFQYFKNTHLPELIANHTNFFVYSSPYAQIPTASFYLAKYFFDAFSEYLKENELRSINLEFCKIRRRQTYTNDYGAMTAEQRYNLIKNDTYELVNIPAKNDVSIFIDDISITGTHQKIIEKLLKENSTETKSIFLYYAKLNNPEVCPSFENRLNYAFTIDLDSLMEIMFSNTYKITTRATKYILSLQKENIEHFIRQVHLHEKYSLLNNLVSMSYANEYNKIELYKLNLKKLKLSINKLKTKPLNF
jgi:FMN phosphatase YigB (HAD superfamily)